MQRPFRNIAICAPATPIDRACAERVLALAAAEFPEFVLDFHEQCFARSGHFAGSDEVRLSAFLDCSNDPQYDAVWFAKGGYGSNRIAEQVLGSIGGEASSKAYIGYSDCGTLLGALYRAGVGQPVHGPMPTDIKRKGGEEAVRRVLGWMAGSDEGLESSLSGTPAAAFNLYTLAMLMGTPLMPNLAGHEVLVEEVGEHLYAIDRLFFHLTSNLGDVAGLRLGEITAIPENDRPFGADVENIARYWCERGGIAYLGRAEIGHSAANRIVPFGLEASRSPA